MRRQGQYGDSSVNSYVSQMQQMSAQRMHGMNQFAGRPDALPSDEDNPYMSSKPEGGHWQWERDGAKGPSPMSSNKLYNEGDGGDASRTFYHGQRPDSKVGFSKQANKDPRGQPHEQDMDIGYEDNAMQQTFEGLTQKFHEEITKLTKEQHEAEDSENARHRERLGEINVKYQEKLTALRAQHASRRDDFLQKELQTRQNQYQQAGMSNYQNNTGPSDPQGYGGAAVAAAAAAAEAADVRRSFGAGQFDSYRERAQYLDSERSHGFESRGPYPGGRAYNTNARYY